MASLPGEAPQAPQQAGLPGLGAEQELHRRSVGLAWGASSSSMLSRLLDRSSARQGAPAAIGPRPCGVPLGPAEDEGLAASGTGGCSWGGTSRRLRGTGLFCRVGEKGLKDGTRGGSWSVAEGGSASMPSPDWGGAGMTWKPAGATTSGTTRASGGILGSESFRGPPQAEQELATGVLCSVQRWQAQPPPGSAAPFSSSGCPLAGSRAASPAVCTGPASSLQLPLGSTRTAGGLGWTPLMTGSGEVPDTGSGAKPHTSQAPVPRRLRNVQRAQGHFCSSTLSRRICSRSGLCRGASQMEHWRRLAGFRKVQRVQDHSPAAAMGPDERVWLKGKALVTAGAQDGAQSLPETGCQAGGTCALWAVRCQVPAGSLRVARGLRRERPPRLCPLPLPEVDTGP